MADRSIRYWHTLTTVEIRREIARDPVVILPLAAIEQHGPHLPLSTDLEIGLGVLASAFRSLPDDCPAWVLPPQAVGCSPEHGNFAGTLSVDAALLSSVIVQHGHVVASCGVKRLLLFNSHGGNRPILETAGLQLRRSGILVVKVNYFELPRPTEVDFPESEWRHGLHGGAVETSMMLHLRPELVRPAEIRDARSLGEDLEKSMERLRPTGPVSFAWLAGDLNPSGAVGNAMLADAAKGGRLVEHYGQALAGAIRDAKAFPIERLA
jgi:creatinine amidohydrolase